MVKLSQVHPELRGAYRVLRTTPVWIPGVVPLIRAVMPLLPDAKAPAGVSMQKLATGGGGEVRVFTPDGGGNGAALLWIHGGGMVIGAAVQDDQRCYQTAFELGIVVVSAEYRLAPQHPFPQPLDDCRNAWEWLQSEASARGIDVNRVAIGGQSAGGGLAAGLVQRLHDEGGVQPAAQWLFCPMLDDRTAADRTLDAHKNILWNNRANRVGWKAYLGAEPGGTSVAPYASPARRADLTGLPPVWIGSGDIELFFTEDKAYAEALNAAGVPSVFDRVHGAPHAFESIAANTTVGSAYLGRAHRWLAERLA